MVRDKSHNSGDTMKLNSLIPPKKKEQQAYPHPKIKLYATIKK